MNDYERGYDEGYVQGVRDALDLKGLPDGRQKITDDQVRELRELHATGEWTQAKLAEKFGITHGYVSLIVRGLSR